MERTDRNCGGWGSYVKIAVVEVESGRLSEPTMISDRARGVIEVVEVWERVYKGKTDRCAAARARREAEALAEQLNCPLTRFITDVDAA